MERFGEVIRRHRIDNNLPLRKVAAYLDIDQAILSKIERGKRMATRAQVLGLARFFKIDQESLLVSWLSDKIVDQLGEESNSMQVLQAAEEKIAYTVRNKKDRSIVIRKIRNILMDFPAVEKAWLFGSFARKDNTPDSDIDILIDISKEISFTLFDMAEIQENLRHAINSKIDLVMLSALRPQVKERIQQDLKLIYEKGTNIKQGTV